MRKNPGRKERRQQERKGIHIPKNEPDPKAVEQARQWRVSRIKTLTDKRNKGAATMKELRELKWKWGVKAE